MNRMAKCIVMLVFLVILSLANVGVGAHAASFSEKAVTSSASLDIKANALVIGLKKGLTETNRLADVIARFGGRIVNRVTVGGEPLALVASVPSDNVSSFEREAQASDLARYFEPDVKFRAQFVPDDPYYSSQWALPKIQADWAWNTTTGNSSILVGVIDTGIDYTHPDLVANYNSSGYDWVNNDPFPLDDYGHGTHVAGIIAAALNNGIGIAGLAQVQIMAEKGLDSNGTGLEDDLANAIYHAVNKGARILSLSWGSDQNSQLIHEAIQYAYSQNVLVVAAAGNLGSGAKFYPASYKEVIGVIATDSNDNRATFSNYGHWVELSAPGVRIYSTMPTYHVTMNNLGYAMDYDYMSGTSMACPYVAALGALVWSRFPNATRDWVRGQLRYTAYDLGAPGFDQYYGYGRINAKKAIEQAPPAHDVSIFNWERPNRIQPGDLVVFNLTVLNFGTSDEQNVIAELFVDGNLQDSTLISDLFAGSSWTSNLLWNPQAEGVFNITLYVVPVAGDAMIGNDRITEEILVQQMLSLNPSQGPAGTKVVAKGLDFSPVAQVMVTFNDALVGFIITDALGNFVFTFDIPFSSAGEQVVKASDSAGNNASSAFVVVDTTPLAVQVDVGAIHFIQETANFYIQTTFKGQAVDAIVTKAALYKPDSTTENLVTQSVSTGIYKIPYTLVGNQTGTYMLVIEASYATATIQATGTSFKSFLVSDTLTLMNGSMAKVQTDLGLIELNLTALNGQVIDIKDGVANVQTDLGIVKLNLTSINATLDSIFLYVKAINGTAATVETTIGTMNGTITSMKNNVATILVPGFGQIKADVSGIKLTQYTILPTVAIAAAGAILSVALLLRLRKRPESTTNP